jgi:hypothetical protein
VGQFTPSHWALDLMIATIMTLIKMQTYLPELSPGYFNPDFPGTVPQTAIKNMYFRSLKLSK